MFYVDTPDGPICPITGDPLRLRATGPGVSAFLRYYCPWCSTEFAANGRAIETEESAS